MKIDTGALVKELKAAAHPAAARAAAVAAAEHFAVVASGARAGLAAVAAVRAMPLGARVVEAASGLLHAALPTLVPEIPPEMALPRPAPALPTAAPAGRDRAVVYFPSCLTRIVGALPGEDFVPPARAMHDVLRWAGFDVRTPPHVDGAVLRHGLREQGLRGRRPRRRREDGRGAVARVRRGPAHGRDRRLAVRRHPRRPRGRAPARERPRAADARLSRVLGA